MTEFRCGSCKELLNLSDKARFCPNCGSTSLNLVVKEQAEPAAKETIGVYTPEPDIAIVEKEDLPTGAFGGNSPSGTGLPDQVPGCKPTVKPGASEQRKK